LVGFADGCVGPGLDKKSNCIASTKVSANGLVNHGVIVRQLTGKTLYSKHDR
jgi:hypothetical protein